MEGVLTSLLIFGIAYHFIKSLPGMIKWILKSIMIIAVLPAMPFMVAHWNWKTRPVVSRILLVLSIITYSLLALIIIA